LCAEGLFVAIIRDLIKERLDWKHQGESRRGEMSLRRTTFPTVTTERSLFHMPHFRETCRMRVLDGAAGSLGSGKLHLELHLDSIYRTTILAWETLIKWVLHFNLAMLNNKHDITLVSMKLTHSRVVD